jgi:hypothetical protein
MRSMLADVNGVKLAFSERPHRGPEAGPPGPLTMEQHADDLAALLDVLEVREPVIDTRGWSKSTWPATCRTLTIPISSMTYCWSSCSV